MKLQNFLTQTIALIFIFNTTFAQTVTTPDGVVGNSWISPGHSYHNFDAGNSTNGNGRGDGANGEGGEGRVGNGSGASPGGPSAHGIGIGVDIAGMNRLSRSIEYREKTKAAIAKYKADSARFYSELTKGNAAVLTAKDLKQAEPVLLKSDMSFDDEDGKLLVGTGESIVIPPFADYGQLTNILKGLGFPISLESIHYETQDKFQVPWMLDAVGEVEAAQLNERVGQALRRTEEWMIQTRSRSEEVTSESLGTFRQAQAVDGLPGVRPPNPEPYEISTTNSEHRQSLRELQQKLNEAKPSTPQGQIAQYIGNYAVAEADRASEAGDGVGFEVWYQIGVTMADVALGFVPVVGTAKDLWEAMTGQSILTGEALAPTERWLAAISAASLGAAGLITKTIKGGVKTTEAIVGTAKAIEKTSLKMGRGKLLREAIEWAPKFAKIAEAEKFAGFKAQRIIPGTTEKVAVIGQAMNEVAGPYAKALEQALRERGLITKVETFTVEAGTMSEIASKELQAMVKQERRMLKDNELVATRVYRENVKWIDKIKKEGYTIIDVGNPKSKAQSVFYEMEKRRLGF